MSNPSRVVGKRSPGQRKLRRCNNLGPDGPGVIISICLGGFDVYRCGRQHTWDLGCRMVAGRRQGILRIRWCGDSVLSSHTARMTRAIGPSVPTRTDDATTTRRAYRIRPSRLAHAWTQDPRESPSVRRRRGLLPEAARPGTSQRTRRRGGRRGKSQAGPPPRSRSPQQEPVGAQRLAPGPGSFAATGKRVGELPEYDRGERRPWRVDAASRLDPVPGVRAATLVAACSHRSRGN